MLRGPDAMIGALNVRAFEGAFIWTPETSPPPAMVAGPGGLVAGTGGLIMGRFGFADVAAGTVANTRTDAGQRLGLVQPQGGGFTRIFRSAGLWYIRQGLSVTLFTGGNFWVRFAGGAYAGEPVYADQTDGHAISGVSGGAEQTPWTVAANAGPGCLGMISTSNYFGA
jgi:hypothetical protein